MYPQFDRGRLRIKPLVERTHDVPLASLLPLDHQPPPLGPDETAAIAKLGQGLVAAPPAGAPPVLIMGPHVIRAGGAPQLIHPMGARPGPHLGLNRPGP